MTWSLQLHLWLREDPQASFGNLVSMGVAIGVDPHPLVVFQFTGPDPCAGTRAVGPAGSSLTRGQSHF